MKALQTRFLCSENKQGSPPPKNQSVLRDFSTVNIDRNWHAKITWLLSALAKVPISVKLQLSNEHFCIPRCW
jgi:hypothetical protein